MEINAVAKRNVFLLSAAQSVAGAAAPLSISIGGLAGFYLLGTDKSLATVPITAFNVGTALVALPAAMLMRRIGRRLGFISGASIAICGMLIAGFALMVANFWLFALGLMAIGGGNSFTQQYRFAAADQGGEKFKVKAISWVLAGGVGAAIIGPQVVIFARDLMAPVEFAGAYFAGVGLLLCGILILSFLKFEKPLSKLERASEDTGRPLFEIITQPRFMVSLICAIGSYTLMAFVMTGAPLAMIGCGISITDSTLGIQWHVMAMFGPSFFTGHLIARFGKERIVAAGLIILISCALVALSGLELWQFWLALILLGIGWNFGFIGATAMLTDCYRPEEKSKAQGANDFMLFSSVAFASFMSGQTLNAYGWTGLNLVVFPVVALCLIALVYLVRHERKIAE
ncbi:MAG: MFS transporter [Hyphomicrobiales bacterium]|nr:MAG: MFS transporter [Hyphomicrobiales bacterium]